MWLAMCRKQNTSSTASLAFARRGLLYRHPDTHEFGGSQQPGINTFSFHSSNYVTLKMPLFFKLREYSFQQLKQGKDQASNSGSERGKQGRGSVPRGMEEAVSIALGLSI